MNKILFGISVLSLLVSILSLLFIFLIHYNTDFLVQQFDGATIEVQYIEE